MADWVTISSLATAGGTLVLAVATFSSVRSSNRSARVAERSLYAGLRPVLIPSREDDPTERVRFGDERLVVIPGHGGALELGRDAIYLGIGLRNGGAGVAVLHGWRASRRHQGGAGDGIAARKQRHIVTQPDQFIGEIGDYSLGSTIKPRRHALHERRDLGNFHFLWLQNDRLAI